VSAKGELMLSIVHSYGLLGLKAFGVTIETDVSKGLPAMIMVGLPDNAVKESKERVRSAIRNSGFKFQSQRVTVNLSPADIKKEGPAYDLAIALGFLSASKQIDGAVLDDYAVLGELSLEGTVRKVSGALSVAMSLPPGRFKGLLVPKENAAEAAIAGQTPVYPVTSLKEVVLFLSDPDSLKPFEIDRDKILSAQSGSTDDFCDVKGQTLIKRGLEVSAGGGHNCVLIGPPGCGKTMLARRLPSILPSLSIPESLETTLIHSVVGLIPAGKGLVNHRPFRTPHHTSSDVALVGGGSIPKPGEVTLAHNGVLFLDELAEFNRNVLESLRQPLEDHQVTISRATRAVNFPAKFMLVASMNPCPCGYLTDPKRECHCSPLQIQKYLTKVSGPLIDRIDIHLEVSALPTPQMFNRSTAESSEQIKKRTTRARAIQKKRFKGTRIFANAQMNPRQIKKHCELDEQGRKLLRCAIDELGLSARAHDKILKVARTICDLEQCENIQPEHIAEAIQYRALDRNWWG